MLDWRQLCELPEEELARHDIAAVNLACAAGLAGSEKIDVARCLETLDQWADKVRKYTDRQFPQFRRRPWECEGSEEYFRAICMITVLQRDLGVRYNPAKIPDDATFDLADTHIHGAIYGAGGTCASLPIVYVAIGRRLGYPLKIVEAYGGAAANHFFVRWDDGAGKRLNIEAAAPGLSCMSDDYYRQGRYATTPEIERAGAFLTSMSPRMELASFMVERGFRWREVRNYREWIDAWAWAHCLWPERESGLSSLKSALNEWTAAQRRRKTAGFPEIHLKIMERRYTPEFPIDLEVDVLGHVATENLLNDPTIPAEQWARLEIAARNGRREKALVDMTRQECHIGLSFPRHVGEMPHQESQRCTTPR